MGLLPEEREERKKDNPSMGLSIFFVLYPILLTPINGYHLKTAKFINIVKFNEDSGMVSKWK